MSIIERITRRLIRYTQKLINKVYLNEDELSDKLLEKQIQLNEIRNKTNINETDDEYVQ